MDKDLDGAWGEDVVVANGSARMPTFALLRMDEHGAPAPDGNNPL